MRDRETDSWWSIMTSDAIGGPMDGADLVELPISEKTTWADWSSRHPQTLVLSIEGVEHADENPYDNYFASDGTFRDLKIDDDRLPPKEPIYSFILGDRAYAIPHSAYQGGRLFQLGGGRRLFLYRAQDAPMFASSEAWLIEGPSLSGIDDPEMMRSLLMEPEGQSSSKVGGFDTFWYSWVAINEQTELLR